MTGGKRNSTRAGPQGNGPKDIQEEGNGPQGDGGPQAEGPLATAPKRPGQMRQASTKLAYRIATVDEVPPGSHKVVRIGKREIGIFNIDDRYYALPNLCPHQLGPLCRGRTSGTLTASEDTGWHVEWTMEGEVITCPWHGLEFEVPTGQCLAYPAIKLKSFEVWVEGSEIVIGL